MIMTKHWLVYRRRTRWPRHRHPSLASAVAEARRLAEANPGPVFLVLEAVEAYRAGADGAVRAVPLAARAPWPQEPDQSATVAPETQPGPLAETLAGAGPVDILWTGPLPPEGEDGWREIDAADPPTGRVDAITRAGTVLRGLTAAHWRWVDKGRPNDFRLWRPAPEA